MGEREKNGRPWKRHNEERIVFHFERLSFLPSFLPAAARWRRHQRSISACGGSGGSCGCGCSVCGTHNQIDLLSLVSPTRPIKSRRRRMNRRKTPKTTAMMHGRGRTLHSTYGARTEGRQSRRVASAATMAAGEGPDAQLQLFPRGRDELGNDNETASVVSVGRSVGPPGPAAVAVRAW